MLPVTMASAVTVAFVDNSKFNYYEVMATHVVPNFVAMKLQKQVEGSVTGNNGVSCSS